MMLTYEEVRLIKKNLCKLIIPFPPETFEAEVFFPQKQSSQGVQLINRILPVPRLEMRGDIPSLSHTTSCQNA
jgi:hypothetical protein